MKFRKKPVVIEAHQFTRESFWGIVQWLDNNNGKMVMWGCEKDDNETYIIIETLEGEMRVSLNDWVIQGVKGEFYPCRDDIFRLTYEGVQE